MGRGLERRHLTQSGDRDDDRPRVFADYGYLGEDSTPLLVAKDTHQHDVCCSRFNAKEVVTRMLHVWLRNGSMDWSAKKSLSEQTENQTPVNSSVVFESSVRKERPLWMRSVLQVTLQALGLLREPTLLSEPRENDESFF